jgi:hypothetical protein
MSDFCATIKPRLQKVVANSQHTRHVAGVAEENSVALLAVTVVADAAHGIVINLA